MRTDISPVTRFAIIRAMTSRNKSATNLNVDHQPHEEKPITRLLQVIPPPSAEFSLPMILDKDVLFLYHCSAVCFFTPPHTGNVHKSNKSITSGRFTSRTTESEPFKVIHNRATSEQFVVHSQPSRRYQHRRADFSKHWCKPTQQSLLDSDEEREPYYQVFPESSATYTRMVETRKRNYGLIIDKRKLSFQGQAANAVLAMPEILELIFAQVENKESLDAIQKTCRQFQEIVRSSILIGAYRVSQRSILKAHEIVPEPFDQLRYWSEEHSSVGSVGSVPALRIHPALLKSNPLFIDEASAMQVRSFELNHDCPKGMISIFVNDDWIKRFKTARGRKGNGRERQKRAAAYPWHENQICRPAVDALVVHSARLCRPRPWHPIRIYDRPRGMWLWVDNFIDRDVVSAQEDAGVTIGQVLLSIKGWIGELGEDFWFFPNLGIEKHKSKVFVWHIVLKIGRTVPP